MGARMMMIQSEIREGVHQRPRSQERLIPSNSLTVLSITNYQYSLKGFVGFLGDLPWMTPWMMTRSGSTS
jgi:hypothetical protein